MILASNWGIKSGHCVILRNANHLFLHISCCCYEERLLSMITQHPWSLNHFLSNHQGFQFILKYFIFKCTLLQTREKQRFYCTVTTLVCISLPWWVGTLGGTSAPALTWRGATISVYAFSVQGSGKFKPELVPQVVFLLIPGVTLISASCLSAHREHYHSNLCLFRELKSQLRKKKKKCCHRGILI